MKKLVEEAHKRHINVIIDLVLNHTSRTHEWYKKAFDANRQNKPCFVRVTVDSEENVLPFVPGGKANIDSIR